MASFLPGKGETCGKKNSLEIPPVNRRQSGHFSGPNHGRMPFNRNPGWADPLSSRKLVPGILEDFFQVAHINSGDQEKVDRFVQRFSGFIGRFPGAHDIQGHCMGNELVSFFPDLNGVFDILRR